VFRSFLSLVLWEKFVPSFAKSSLKHSLIIAIAYLLGRTEPSTVSSGVLGTLLAQTRSTSLT